MVKESTAIITRPIAPLSLSRNMVATTSLVLFVYVARSMLRIISPPILEGRNKLKKIPPEKEINILFKVSFMSIASRSIFQRNNVTAYPIKKKQNARLNKGLFALRTISNKLRLSTCLNSHHNRITLMPILRSPENICLMIFIYPLNSFPVMIL